MAGHPDSRARSIAVVVAAGLAVLLAGTALAVPLPGASPRPAAPGALPPGSVETPGSNELVSTPQLSRGATGASPATRLDDIFAAPTISASGRYVVFLQESDPESGSEVVLRDRARETTTVIGRPDGNGPLSHPTISADGRWIAYTRPIDGPNPTEVVVVERTTGQETRVNDLPGRNFFPDQPVLSGDGRFLVVRADASSGTELLLLDRTAGGWETISVDVNNRPTGGTDARAGQPAISDDGRWVAFTALDSVLFAAGMKPESDFRQVYLRDRVTQTTVMLSVNVERRPGRDHSLNPAMSGDGSLVAFPSGAGDLVPDGAFEQLHVYAWSATTGGIELLSRAPDGVPGNGPSGYPAVTRDGGSVAFASAATNLVPGDTTGGPDLVRGNLTAVRSSIIGGDIFVRDRGAARTSRVSMARDNAEEANGLSTFPSISSTGRFVAFTSVATNLVATDSNEQRPDVFVRDRPPGISASPNPIDFGSAPAGSLGSTRPATIRSTGVTAVRVGEITISGTNASDFVVAANPCTGQTLPPGSTCELQVLFVGTASGDRAATLRIASNAGDPVSLRLVGAVGVAKLKVEPPQGPAGLVVIATGTGFPPNAPVTLTWSVGITATPLEPVVSDATGGFRAQVLIIPRDRDGRRNLRAVASLPGLDFKPVTARFLVVPSTAAPPTSSLVYVFAGAPGRPIISRP